MGANGWNVMLHFGQDRVPWTGSVLALYVLRLLTVGFGAMALLAIYRATRLLFPDHRWAQLGATALIVWSPDNVYVTHLDLGIPVQKLPPRLYLRVGALSKDGQEYLPAQDASGHSQGDEADIIGDLLVVGAATD